ncbi:SDR family NAD(P)-dependent oxidoreductase [Pseudomaricurvus sp.]|uniref:SDR family NAD(P)-dependent oxidoreductase n=1 Tax=Pseudomaricurvus sp. TaxID=2004510 RepID=UPI003F6A67E1
MTEQQQKVAVVTGASSGIGLAAAKALSLKGYRIIGVGRNSERTKAAGELIRTVSAGNQVDMIRADLALMSEAARVAEEVSHLTGRIDLLINNAGGMASEKVMTAEGFEESFAGNHFGPFVLTTRLLPLLRQAVKGAPQGSVRIINTSSDGSEMIPGINLDDLQTFETYTNGLAYCSSKLANVLFSRALAKRLAPEGIVAHSFHPGTIGSNFFSHTDESVRERYGDMEKLTPDQGAETLLWLAMDDEPAKSNGGYFYKCKPRTPNPLIEDDQVIEDLWRISESLTEEALAKR